MPGSARTYVYTGGEGLDAEAWKRGLREGRAFVSTGPLVELTVDGQPVTIGEGDGVELAPGVTIGLKATSNAEVLVFDLA